MVMSIQLRCPTGVSHMELLKKYYQGHDKNFKYRIPHFTKLYDHLSLQQVVHFSVEIRILRQQDLHWFVTMICSY